MKYLTRIPDSRSILQISEIRFCQKTLEKTAAVYSALKNVGKRGNPSRENVTEQLNMTLPELTAQELSFSLQNVNNIRHQLTKGALN